LKYSGSVVYEITVPKELLRSVVEFRDDKNEGVVALAPWQVLSTSYSAFEDQQIVTLGEAGEGSHGILKTFRVIKMKVVCDYKDTVKWPRRELIVPEYSQ
jgi:hypothetical protein